MMSCPDFEPWKPHSPTMGPVYKPLRIGGGIASIPWVYIYEGLKHGVIKSCLMSPCVGANCSIFKY